MEYNNSIYIVIKNTDLDSRLSVSRHHGSP